MNEKYIGRLIAASLFIAVIAGNWDVWWHGFIGRNIFWEPPHILLYSAVIVSILLGFYGWYKTKEKIWKRVALALLLVLIAAPFDELWHRIFGVESALNPIIVWSPPHLVLVGAIITTLLMLLSILKKDKNIFERQLFAAIIFASVISLALFIVSPFQPIGPYNVIGFYGPFFITFVFIGFIFASEKIMKTFGSATLIALILIAISAVSFGETADMKGFAPPHDHPPSWVSVFSFLVPALILDLTRKSPQWLRGSLAGLSFCLILYPLSNLFFTSGFQYSTIETYIAIASGTLGGFASSILLKKRVK